MTLSGFDSKVDDLIEALEEHGNNEGTESQLNLTTAFLEIALDLMPAAVMAKFFAEQEIRDFVNSIEGEDEQF